jgi:multiple sugar transport system ATP-binding protein
MARVRFDKLTKSFGTVRVLEALDLTINEGEFFTFVGPSGCGKSTILNMIAGLENPSGGRIYFDEQPINFVPTRERDVAMVFQSYALYPHLTVFDNIGFPLKMRKTPGSTIASEVERTASILGIGELLQRKPRELSGGQRQRVALARAIIRKPRVFLLDEPLSNLDARLRIDMRAELKLLHQRLKITTIYVTHDQEEAMGLSERIAVLHGGRVQQCGTPHEIYTRPANMFVAGFLGSPPMNFLPAKVKFVAPPEIEISGKILQLPDRHLPHDGAIVIGVRPEDLVLSLSDGDCEAAVATAEFAGSGSWVEFDWLGNRLKGFLPEETHGPIANTLRFNLPPAKCYVFDGLTTQLC